jgi:hypothetical protein
MYFFFIFIFFIFMSAPGWGYDWWTHINMDVTLPFWVIMRSGRWNGMNHIASMGDHIWSSGCGELFYHESYCDERVVMTIYGFQIFWWRQFRGVGLCPYMAYGRGLPIYGDAATPRVFWGGLKLITPYYLHLFTSEGTWAQN